jgi:hypothetical protein
MAYAWRRNKDVLGLPFIACGMWLYLYGSMAYGCAVNLADLLPTWTLEFGQLVALLSLMGLLIGWHCASRSHRKSQSFTIPPAKYALIWRIGIVLLFIALVGQYTFMRQEVIDYQNTSNYWYLMFYIGYPATALCLFVLIKDKSGPMSLRAVFLGVLILALMWQPIVTARRGPLMPMVIVILYIPYLVRKRRPNRLVVGSGLAIGSLAMLTFLYMRPYSYAPDGVSDWTMSDRLDGWQKGLRDLSWEAVFSEKQKTQSDNEYLYHCGMVATIWEFSDYQYGTGYLTLLVNWVPRQLWKSKPALGQGLLPSQWQDQLPGVVGWSMSTGAAGGGAAEVFGQFGIVSPLFWAIVGALASKLYRRSAHTGDELATAQYVGFLCTLHWLVAQGFAAMFIPACYFILIPTVVISRYRTRANSTSIRRGSTHPMSKESVEDAAAGLGLAAL